MREGWVCMHTGKVHGVFCVRQQQHMEWSLAPEMGPGELSFRSGTRSCDRQGAVQPFPPCVVICVGLYGVAGGHRKRAGHPLFLNPSVNVMFALPVSYV
jgi:hypothetical protein